ncbi:patatin-like phospholipase family protein [Cyanobacteria bacterium FACHB-DQ100]|nr:patatin-like phospholipase family protein [Cyanobacteria bacterium FACHB-DQ100]
MIKILSIDGGGIRGILPAMLLAEIEDRTNRPTVELFDLIAGTSTGGILALGLNKPDLNSEGKPQYSAKKLVNLYENEGSKIFPLHLYDSFYSKLGAIDHPKYPFQPLEEILDTYFGETRLSESLKDVLITSYDLERRRPHLFLSSQARNRASEDFLMKQVGRATSAAPTYFEPLKLKKPSSSDYYALIDGGVFSNNPTLYAYAYASAEARRVHRDANDFLLISLGTGELAPRMPYEEARTWGLVEWAQPILNVVFDGVSDAVHSQLQQLFPEDRYYRIQAALGGIGDRMDNANKDNITALKILADNMIKDNDRLIDKLCELLVK